MDRRDRRYRLNGANSTTGRPRGGDVAQTYRGNRIGIFSYDGRNIEVILREEGGVLVARQTANAQPLAAPIDTLKRWWDQARECPDAAARLSAAFRPARQKCKP